MKKTNKKIDEWIQVYKKFIIYQLELVQREKDENKLTIIFDCSNMGLSNVDIDMMMFMMSLFRNYYPMFIHKILIHQLSWVLNFVLKLINSLLRHEQSELLDLINKNELNDFLNGTSNLPYKTSPKNVKYAHDLAPQLSIIKSAADKLTRHLQQYI